MAASSLLSSTLPPETSKSASASTLSSGPTRLTLSELEPALTTRTLTSSLAWHGGRVHPGRDFVPCGSSVAWRVLYISPNSREDEQPRRRSRPGDEKEPPGSFSYLVR